jgi:hypothetical protein
VADLIGTLDPDDRASVKIVSHLLPTWYRKETFIHLVTSTTRTRESKVTTLIQNRPLTSRKTLTRKRMMDALFAGALSIGLVHVLTHL